MISLSESEKADVCRKSIGKIDKVELTVTVSPQRDEEILKFFYKTEDNICNREIIEKIERDVINVDSIYIYI